MNVRSRRVAVALMTCALLGVVSESRAEDGAISVSPAVVMMRGDHGQSASQTLSFTNGTAKPFSFEMIARDAVVRDGKRSFVDAGVLSGSIAASATFSRRTITLAPHATAEVVVMVTIPLKSAVRAIAVMCQGTTPLEMGRARITASVGTLITFTLTGDQIAADTSPLLVKPPTASSSLVATQRIANSGSAPFVAAGTLAILDAKGGLAGKQAVPSWRLLPGESTEISVEFGGLLPPGEYRGLVTYDLAGESRTSSAAFTVH